MSNVSNDAAQDPSVGVGLLGGFCLFLGRRVVHIPASAQRLVAFVALSAPTTRALVAGVLWPHVDERRAQASLRTSIWQVHRRCPGLLNVYGSDLRFSEGVHVDVSDLEDRAHRIVEEPQNVPLAELIDELTTRELLPGWYDEWVLLERERSRQLRLHTLEASGEELLARHKPGPALDAALSAVRTEPLRESANSLVIRIHLWEGNTTEAVRHYMYYVRLLGDELGVLPTARFQQLVADLPALRTPLGDARMAPTSGR